MVEDSIFSNNCPAAFVFRNRYHETLGWKMLTHSLVEDIICSGMDKYSEKILDRKLNISESTVCLTTKEKGSRRLSNGRYFQYNLDENKYALICLDLCKIYDISPMDLRILYKEDFDDYGLSIAAEYPSTPVELKNYPADEIKGKKTEVKNTKEIKKEPVSDEIRSVSDNLYSKSKNNKISDIIEKAKPEVSDKDEKSSISEPSEKETESDKDTVPENESEDDYTYFWDDVIDYFKDVDNATETAAKRMQKFGLPEPSDIDFEVTYSTLSNTNNPILNAYEGRILGTAAMVWKKQKTVYLSKQQKACSNYFRTLGYKVINEDVKALQDALGTDSERGW